MTRQDFALAIAYLATAVGRNLSPEAMEVYYDALGDLAPEVLRIAVKRVALEHKWASFPSIAQIREAAMETQKGEISPLSAHEAWSMAYAAARKIDLDIDGSVTRHTEGLPPIVREAMRQFGIAAMVTGHPEFMRPQFLKIFEALQAQERRRALLPAPVRRAIAQIGNTLALEDQS